MLFTGRGNAQLCNGTLGEPIFIETFGAGTGSGSALPAGVTTYNYTPNWPVDGEYTIANTSNPAPGNPHWYTGSDHTGNLNGYMLVVNASYTAGEFYKYTVNDLCPNTNYVFSAWIANVNNFGTINFCNTNDPPYVYTNVLFKVTNTVTLNSNSISTGNISPGNTNMVWHEFGFTFSTGPNQTSVILSMINNSNGGCGNDLVIDDISFRPCGPKVSIIPVPNKAIYCTSDSLVLDATLGFGYTNPVFQWQYSSNNGISWQDIPGATSEDLNLYPVSLNNAGKYRLLLAENGNIHTEKCRIIADTITLVTALSPTLNLSALPATICEGQTSTLSVSGTTSYLWENGSTGSSLLVSPSATHTYQVTGTDTLTGCQGHSDISVYVIPLPASPILAQPDSICSGTAIALSASPAGGTYNWYTTPGGGTPLFMGNPFTTPVLTATITYYAEAVAGGMCPSATRTPVTVNVIPIPAPPVVAEPDSVCAGTTSTISAGPAGGLYNWYTSASGGTAFFVGNPYTTPTLSSTATYYVEAVAGGKCPSATRTPVTVHVIPIPASPVLAQPDSICEGTTSTLSANPVGAVYNWYTSAAGGTAFFAGNPYTTPILASTTTYYVEALAGGKCPSATRTPVTVNVIPIPASPLALQPDSICSGNITTLNVSPSGATYYWYTSSSGGTAFYTGNPYTTNALTNTVTYYVETVAGGKCPSVTRTPVTVNVLNVNASFTANTLSGYAPLQVNFNNQSTNADYYHWYLDNQVESSLLNPSHTYSINGQGAVYEVILIASIEFGCSDTARLNIHVEPFSKLIIPNIFTPNNDGVNDLFKVESIGLTVLKAELYNR